MPAARRASAMCRKVGELLAPVNDEQQRLVAALDSVRELLGDSREPAAVTLRPPAAGDLGWIIERNAAVYDVPPSATNSAR